MSGWANHSPGDPWGDLREGRRREASATEVRDPLGDAWDEPDTGVPPCDFCRREVPCECAGRTCMCTCGRCPIVPHPLDQLRPDPDQNVPEPPPDAA